MLETAIDGMEQQEEKVRTKLRWLLAGLTVAAYWRVSSHGFINYDDPAFVSANPHVYTGLTFANLKWAFTTLNGDATSYQPLVWLTHQLDCQLVGLLAGPQHLTNLWLHVANTVLIFTVLDKLTGRLWRSAVVAALFALHPLHVETVAWISERKSLVCALFWLLTILAYTRYVSRGGARNYLLVLLLFAAALLSKPIAVSLPFTLLLLDFWPLARYGRKQTAPLFARLGQGLRARVKNRSSRGDAALVSSSTPDLSGDLSLVTSAATRREGFLRHLLAPLLVEKAPLFLLSGVACWVTMLAQTELGATQSLAVVPMAVRLSNSVMACLLYLRKMLWPVDLAPIYPLRYDWAWWQVFGSGLLLLSISLWTVRQAKRRPYLVVGWCWYLVTLLPTLGLVQVGLQGMADRYTYVPLTGVFLLVVWEVSERTAGVRQAKPVLGIGAATVTAACALCTIANVQYWRASTPLFEHAVRVTRNNYVAYRILGTVRKNQGDLREAEKHYRESLRIEPNRAPTHRLLGVVLFQEGDSPGAFEQYSLALKINPRDFEVHRELAELFIGSTGARFHDQHKALEHARLACELSHYRKRDLVALLAQTYIANNQLQEAATAAQRLVALSVAPEEIQAATELVVNIQQKVLASNEGTVTPALRDPIRN